VEPLLPRVALYFIMADCYVVALALAPSSHCCSRRLHFHCFAIVTAHPHLRRNLVRRKKRQKKSIFIYAQILRKTNLDPIFSESRSGTIAHKNKKRITAGTHFWVQKKFLYFWVRFSKIALFQPAKLHELYHNCTHTQDTD
jgi:hypothetical protein